LLSFNSKLSHFDKNLNLNLNLNHKWLSPTWRNRYGFDLWRSLWTFRASTASLAFVNVVQHLRNFGPFEINKRDIGRQREDRSLVAEEEILHEIENQPRRSTYASLANHLGVSCKLLRKLLKTEAP
jgi:hypothetical protein